MFSSSYKILLIVILSFVLVACKDDDDSSSSSSSSSSSQVSEIYEPTPTPTKPEIYEPPPIIPIPEIIEPVPIPPIKDRIASLTWDAPFTRTNGDSISMGEIKGYIVSYSQDIEDMDKKVFVSNDGLGSSGVVIDGLADGVWYFTVQTEDTAGLVSVPSDTVNKVI